MGFCSWPSERVKRASVIYHLKESKWAAAISPGRVKVTVKGKKEASSRVKMGQETEWAKDQNGPRIKMGLCYLPPERVKMGCCILPPDRVNLRVKWKKEANSRVKMDQESKWAKGQDGLLLFTPWKSQNGLLLFTPWQSQTNSEQQERNKQQGQNGPKVKMSLCFLPLKESKWSKCQDGLMPFTRWKSQTNQTNSEQQERNKQQSQNGPRVKMYFCYLPPERVEKK